MSNLMCHTRLYLLVAKPLSTQTKTSLIQPHIKKAQRLQISINVRCKYVIFYRQRHQLLIGREMSKGV